MQTGLLPYSAEIIFKHKGKIQPTISGRNKFQDHHTVCVVKASGKPKAGGGDAKRIGFYYTDCNMRISTTTKEIIERYYEWKRKHQSVDNSVAFDEDEENEDTTDILDSGYDFEA